MNIAVVAVLVAVAPFTTTSATGMPGKDPGGLIITVLLGIGGAFVGGWIGARLGIASFNGFTWQGILVATGGAVVLLLVYRLVRGDRR